MKLLVLGARGMLGTDLLIAGADAGLDMEGFDLPEVDICAEKSGLDDLPNADWVVNCAAYTDVDGAETSRDKAFAVNSEGAGRVADWCAASGTRLLHVSTDYVFKGDSSSPLREDDPTGPLSVYGQSKLAGEEAVQAALGNCVIARTQSLFGAHGKNFVKAIMSRLEEGASLRVVSDQTVSPTYTVHFADAILRLLKAGKEGIVHVSASDSCTWHEFACAIAEKVKPGAVVEPVKSAEYARPARRPDYSVFDTSRYRDWTGHSMPSWREGLEEYLGAVSW